VKKDVKSKVAAKKWLDGRLMAKILIMTIQVNLCHAPSPLFTRIWHQIYLNCCYAISLPSSHFLAATLDFTSFYHNAAFLGAADFLYSWAVLD